MKVIVRRDNNFFYFLNGKTVPVTRFAVSPSRGMDLVCMDRLTYQRLVQVLFDLMDDLDVGPYTIFTVAVSLRGNDGKTAISKIRTFINSEKERITEINLVIGLHEVSHEFESNDKITKIYAKKEGDVKTALKMKKLYPKELKGSKEMNENI